MNNNQPPVDHKAHLKVAMAFFGGWLFVVIAIFNNIQELGGVNGLIQEIGAGSYSDLLLIALSIFFLAQAFNHLFKFLRLQRRD